MARPFPPVPRSPFWSSDEAAARAALTAIDEWRRELALWLRGPERDDGISPAVAAVMLELLGAAETDGYRRYPYRLARFPAPAGAADPCAAMREVLLWRAGIVDFLADVWDTMGEADFGIEECQRVTSLFTPAPSAAASSAAANDEASSAAASSAAANDEASCPLCLEPLPPGASARHFDACAVQASWRAPSA